ncbi:energy transducer TonB [Mucilaginibacter sp. CSA2-8R]|uniref:energy transducer TonB n=1 Tax=Mucilaginibacter sp. CSA2-8R TaxID=3141542 RepID=UPI00315C90F6
MNTKLITSLVALAFILFTYSAKAQIKPDTAANAAAPEKEIFYKVEKIPEFPGGIEKFIRFLDKNLNKKKAKTPTRINVTFVVEKDGSLSNIGTARTDYDPQAAEEAIRVIKLSPKWKPGEAHGQPCRVNITFPVLFD